MNCYNGQKYLQEALDSIINQTYKHWELIFWDNQSTDQSREIFHRYDDARFRYFLAPEHTDLGGGRARATALSQTKPGAKAAAKEEPEEPAGLLG